MNSLGHRCKDTKSSTQRAPEETLRSQNGCDGHFVIYKRVTNEYVSVMKSHVLPIRADDELLDLITKASKITRLNKSEVTRQSIRLGAAELVRRYATGKPSLVEYLADFRGLEISKRRYPIKRRS